MEFVFAAIGMAVAGALGFGLGYEHHKAKVDREKPVFTRVEPERDGQRATRPGFEKPTNGHSRVSTAHISQKRDEWNKRN